MSNFCGSCGAQRHTPTQAFCHECGAQLAPAPSAPPPQPVAPPAQPVTHPVTQPVTQPGSDYAVPAALPPTAGGRFPVGRVVGVGALVLALAGGGLVGWQFLAPKGGADSPEQAVRQFVDAAASQDVLGVLDMVAPAEVDGVDDLVSAARDRLADEDVTTTSGDLTDALTVTIEDLDVDADEVGDDMARVVLRSGSYRVDYDPGEVPDRLQFIADRYDQPKSWSGDLLEESGGLPDANYRNEHPDPFLMTQRVDGRWYVTAVGTFLDAMYAGYDAYDDSGIREPDYDAVGEDVEPVVGKDPEDVLGNIAEAASSGDVSELLANFPSDEVAAMRPYARTVEDLFADDGLTFEVSVDGVDTDTEELGDGLTKVTVHSGTVYGSYSDEDGYEAGGSADVDGRCFGATDDYGDTESTCIEGDVVDKTGLDSLYYVVREVDGGYQLDPIATAVDYARTVIDAAPSSLIDDAIDELESDM